MFSSEITGYKSSVFNGFELGTNIEGRGKLLYRVIGSHGDTRVSVIDHVTNAPHGDSQ